MSILNSLETQLNGPVEKDQETTSPISKLPNELLIKILYYLSTQDLRGNVAHVSKQFKELCKSPLVHQVVTFNACKNEAEFLREATMMTELHLKAKHGQNCQEELMAITNHCHLKVLHVNGCVTLDSQYFYRLSSSKWWNNLRGFHLELVLKSYDEIVQLPDYDSVIAKLGCNGNMIHFGFGPDGGSYGTLLDQNAVLNLIKGPGMKNLKSLIVCEPYSDSQVLEIVEARKETLEDMEIYSNFSDFNFVTLCHKIKHLSIDQTLYMDLHILPKLKNLTHLEIFLTDHSYEDELLQITNDLPKNSLPSLTSLKLQVETNSAEVKLFQKT